MAETWLIGDTHFGHRKMPELRGFASMEEHDEVLIARWNAVVRKHDTVWHLGDVLFGRPAFACLDRLNGTKKLVAGNHDGYPTTAYLAHFNRVVGAVEIANCILTHIPVHESQFHRYRANIHGHLHTRTLNDPRWVCVSAEQNNLTPIALGEVLARLPAATDSQTTERPGNDEASPRLED
jgi:calcineurin-like phosphoesterase family protein